MSYFTYQFGYSAYLGILNIPEEVNGLDIIRQRDEFSNKLNDYLQYVNVTSVIADANIRHSHLSMVAPARKPKRGHPPIDYISARYKIAEANSRDEALGWMSNKEKIALLESRDDMSALARLTSV
jgi:membrane glycosyltransferase